MHCLLGLIAYEHDPAQTPEGHKSWHLRRLTCSAERLTCHSCSKTHVLKPSLVVAESCRATLWQGDEVFKWMSFLASALHNSQHSHSLPELLPAQTRMECWTGIGLGLPGRFKINKISRSEVGVMGFLDSLTARMQQRGWASLIFSRLSLAYFCSMYRDSFWAAWSFLFCLTQFLSGAQSERAQCFWAAMHVFKFFPGWQTSSPWGKSSSPVKTS